MNYIKHLTGFFDKLVHDYDLNPTHVSLYISLFQFWNLKRFENPISITRDEVMRISKICSKATYHKCMRELHEKGYVIYEPSYNPFRGSLVRMVNLSSELKPLRKKEATQLKNKQVIEQEVNKNKTSSVTSNEQALVSSINTINNTNSKNNVNLEEKEKIKKNHQLKNLENTIPPAWPNVMAFFIEKKANEIDAQKFYNHFQSNGWLIGGKTKMIDWHAAARNWMLNTAKFTINLPQNSQTKEKPKAKHLQVSEDKNYAEPL